MEVTRLDERATMRVRHPLRLAVGVASAAVLTAALLFPDAGAAAGCGSRGTACKWLATWAASPMAAAPARLAAPDDFSSAGFDDQTIRDIIWTSAGGQAARISLSNQFGTRPVTFSQIDIGISAGGHMSVTIAPRAAAVSDPVAMAIPAQSDLAVSLYAIGPTGPATYHSDAQQINYISASGDYAGSQSAAGFTITSQHWYFLDEVDVQAGPATSGTIVAFGDSITDGWRSTVDADDGGRTSWPSGSWPSRRGRSTRSSTRASPVTGSWPTRFCSA